MHAVAGMLHPPTSPPYPWGVAYVLSNLQWTTEDTLDYQEARRKRARLDTATNTIAFTVCDQHEVTLYDTIIPVAESPNCDPTLLDKHHLQKGNETKFDKPGTAGQGDTNCIQTLSQNQCVLHMGIGAKGFEPQDGGLIFILSLPCAFCSRPVLPQTFWSEVDPVHPTGTRPDRPTLQEVTRPKCPGGL